MSSLRALLSSRRTVALVAAASMLVAAPATAKISKSLEKELRGYVEKFKDSEEDEPRSAAILTWGHLADRKERKKLEALLSDKNDTVRIATSIALIHSGARSSGRKRLVAELGKTPALGPTLHRMVSLLPADREKRVLEDFLDDAKPERRRTALGYLAGREDGLFALVADRTTHKEADVREAAAAALREHPDARVLPVCEEMLGSKYSNAQSAAVAIAASLSEMSSLQADAIKVLVEALSLEKNPAAVERAARRLVELERDKGARKLVEIMVADKEDAAHRKEIARFLLDEEVVLTKTESISKKLAETKDTDEKSLYYELLVAAGDKKAIATLEKLYRDSIEFSERKMAMRALARTGDTKYVDMIYAQGLFSSRADTRRMSARGLRMIGSPKGIPALKRALERERKDEIKLAIVEALGAIQTPKSLRVLRFKTTVNDPKFKRTIARAVRSIGLEKGTKVLDMLLRDRNDSVQWEAFLALLVIAPDKAKKRLSSALRNPPEGYFSDILELPEARRDMLIEKMLRGASPRLRGEALGYANLHAPRYAKLVRAVVVDADVAVDTRRAIAERLAMRQRADDKSIFEKLTRDAHTTLHRLAGWTLVRYGGSDLEANFRGFLTHDDDVMKMLGAYGLATLHD
jgi:HEAT repeat protein